MTISWVVFGVVVGFLVAAAAWAAEGAARIARLPVRWIWGGAIVLTAILVVSAPYRRVSPSVATYPSGAIASLKVTQINSDRTIGLGDALRGVGQAVDTTVRHAMAILGRSIPAWLDRYIAIGWLSLSLVLITLYGLVLVRLRRLQRGWPLIELFGARVRLSPDGGPVVVGLTRAEIVVPRWLLHAQPDEQRLVLAHEREHVRAHDPLLLTICCGLAALVPWHPAVWWMLSRLRLAVELDCDRRVLQQGAPPRDYATLLVDLAERNAGFPLAPALSVQTSHLRKRILAMKPAPMRFALARGGALAIFACASLFVACGARAPVVAVAPEAAAAGVKDSVAVVAPVTRPVPVRDTARAPRPASPFDSGPVTSVMVDGVSLRRAYVVVDGVRLGLISLDSLKNLDPMSIETVEVLKGSAAAAVYGPEGADGVVLITTRRNPGPTRREGDAGARASLERSNPPLSVEDGVVTSGVRARPSQDPAASAGVQTIWSSRDDIERSGLGVEYRMGPAPQSQPLVSLSFEAASLSEVVRAFVRVSGRTIVVSSELRDVTVTAEIKGVDWQRALDDVLSAQGLAARVDMLGTIVIDKLR